MVRNLFTLITSAPLVVLLLFVLISWYMGVIFAQKVCLNEKHLKFEIVRSRWKSDVSLV